MNHVAFAGFTVMVSLLVGLGAFYLTAPPNKSWRNAGILGVCGFAAPYALLALAGAGYRAALALLAFFF